jgi:hypothetical protein
MLRFLSRFIGLWLLAGALVALVVDGSKTIAAGGIVTTSLGAMWTSISPQSLIATEAVIVDSVGPALWNPVIQSILNTPGFVVFGVLGIVLMLLGRKKRRLKLSELEIG